jgi:hypothetical protein
MALDQQVNKMNNPGHPQIKFVDVQDCSPLYATEFFGPPIVVGLHKSGESMAIYGIGADYDHDISQDFLGGNFVGVG